MSTKHVPNVLDPFDGANYLTREQRAEQAAGLRKMADWIEATEFPIPRTVLFSSSWANFTAHGIWMSDKDFLTRPGSAARLIGGKVDKGIQNYSTDFVLTREFGGGIKFRFTIEREAVCTSREETKAVEKSVPVDEQRASELEGRIAELREQQQALPKEVRLVPTTVTIFDCPPALLPAEKTAVAIDDSIPF